MPVYSYQQRADNWVESSTTSNYGDNSYSFINQWTSKNQYRSTNTVANYKKLIAAGQAASSEYIRAIQQVWIVPDLVHASMHRNDNPVKTRTHTTTGCLSVSPTQNGSNPDPDIMVVSTNLYNRLMVNFLNKVRQQYESMDGATFLGELTKTLHGLRHPAQSFRRGLSKYLDTIDDRTRDLSKIYNRNKRLLAATEAVAGTWLEYRFSFLTTLSDTKAAGNAYNELLDAFDDERVTVATSLEEMSQLVEMINPTKSLDGGTLPIDYQRKTTELVVSARMVGMIKRVLHRPSFQERFGLTLSNFVPTVWNLLPFSFVTDYFINIGDCLSAGGTSVKDLVFVCCTHRGDRLVKITSHCDLATYADSWANGLHFTIDSLSHSPGSYENHSQSWWRQIVNPNDITVIPTINLPTLDTQWINMGALVAQAASVSKRILRALGT